MKIKSIYSMFMFYMAVAWMATTLLLLVNGIDLGPEHPTTSHSFVDDEELQQLLPEQCDQYKDDCGGLFDGAFEEQPHRFPRSSMLYLDWVHVGIVACGDRQPETAVAVKAIVVTATSNVFVHIFTEDDLQNDFYKEFGSWPEEIRNKFKYKLYPITYPPGRFNEWKKVFKTCATQRLFIPLLLRNVDSMLYIDTDILIMRPVEDIWAHFNMFNSSQLAAVAPEHESPNAGWYNRFARHPYYGKLGINSGVMLMNLTRIRQFSWLTHINGYYEKYRYNITWGDQDLLNILFHYYPEFVYTYDCAWNYRPDHCMYMSLCKPAEVDGISVIHGSRGVLHNDKHPQFKAVYDAFVQYKFDGISKLVESMKEKLNALGEVDGKCQEVKELFTKQLEKHVK